MQILTLAKRPALAIATLAAGAAMIAQGAAACSLSASPLAFGELGLLVAPVDVTAEIAVDCAAGVPFAVEIDGGQAGAGPSERRLSSGAAQIPYGLFRNVGRTSPWGTGVAAMSGTGTGAAQPLTVYGRVPTQTAPTPGAYSDAVIVTLVF